ncbi:hypothetical protein AB0M57_12980 [Streptomyces sp. NPDC051597]|uniref:hypothetical protein n=1 Tax=Streptomyces sp. NPDC051597 TaxID=3155049 RepID=UPI00343FDD3F
MDQRTDDQHTALTAALNAAALNPAHVPGLMPAPAPTSEAQANPQDGTGPGAEPEGAVTEGRVTHDAATDDAVTDDAVEDAAAGAVPAAGPDAGTDAPAAELPASEAADDGPVFSVSDRRGSITADRSGIRLCLDGEEAAFGWDELSAVEYATSRWTRRFTITVHLPRPRWFRNDVQAEDRASLEQWSEQLEEVLNAYFEE